MKVTITDNDGIVLDTVVLDDVKKEWALDGINNVSPQDFAEIVKDAVLNAMKISLTDER